METFLNPNYAPELSKLLDNSFAAMMIAQAAAHPKSALDPHHRKVALGHAIQAAEKVHLKDWQIDQLFDAMEAQLEEMLDSDAIEVYERYEAYRQAERDEMERMEAQEEYNYELKQVIERGESYASLEAS